MRRFCGDPWWSVMKPSLRGPCRIISWWQDLVEILVKFSWRNPCMDNFQMPCIRVPCNEDLEDVLFLEVLVWQLFWDAFGRFYYQDSVRSSPAAASPFMAILLHSLRGPGAKIFVNALRNSLWKDPVEILVKRSERPLHDLVRVLEKIFLKSILEFLVFRSWKCFAPGKLLWESFWDAHRKLLHEDLTRPFVQKVLPGRSRILWNLLV